MPDDAVLRSDTRISLLDLLVAAGDRIASGLLDRRERGHGMASLDEPLDVPLTRIEVLDFVGEAFGGRPVDRTVLIETAAAAGARDVLMTRLRALPAVHFADPEDLWTRLPDVPEDLQRA